jgi:hypothetical protein
VPTGELAPLICSEQDEEPDDSLVILRLRDEAGPCLTLARWRILEIWRYQSSARPPQPEVCVAVHCSVDGVAFTVVDLWMAVGDSSAAISMSMGWCFVWSYATLKRQRSDLDPFAVGDGLAFCFWAVSHVRYGSVRSPSSLPWSRPWCWQVLSVCGMWSSHHWSAWGFGALTWAEAVYRPADVRGRCSLLMMASVIMAVVGALLYYVRRDR